MKRVLHYLLQRVRSLLIDLSCSVMNWISDRLSALYDRHGVDEIDAVHATAWARLLFWIDARASDVFQLAFPGSDEELEQVLDGCIPAQHLDDRLRAVLPKAFPNPCASCNSCQWVGFIHQAKDYTCPSCGDDGIYWTDRSMAWVPYRDYRALTLPSCSAVKGGAA